MLDEMMKTIEKLEKEFKSERKSCACLDQPALTWLIVLLAEKAGIKPKDLGKMLVEEQEELRAKTTEFAKAGLIEIEKAKYKEKVDEINELK